MAILEESVDSTTLSRETGIGPRMRPSALHQQRVDEHGQRWLLVIDTENWMVKGLIFVREQLRWESSALWGIRQHEVICPECGTKMRYTHANFPPSRCFLCGEVVPDYRGM